MLAKLRLTGIIGFLLFTLAPAACGDGAKQSGADGGGGSGGSMAGAGGGAAGAPGGRGGTVGSAGAPGGGGGAGGSGGASGAGGGGTGGQAGGAGGQGGGCPPANSSTINPGGACAGGTNCSGMNMTCDCVNGFWRQCRIPTCPPSTISDLYACMSDVELPAGCHCNLVPPGTQNIPYCLCNGT